MALSVVGALGAAVATAAIVWTMSMAELNRPPLVDCEDESAPACDGVFPHGGQDLRYRLLRAPSTAPPRALFVMLHGSGLGAAAQAWLSDGALSALAVEKGVHVLLPDAGGEDRVWRDGESPEHPVVQAIVDQAPAVLALIDALSAEAGIPREHVVVAGYSNGGTMAMRLACEAPTPFLAVATFGSPTTRRQLAEGCRHPTPIALVHGTADHTNRFDGGHPTLFGVQVAADGLEPPLSSPRTVAFWREVNGCAARARTTPWPDEDPTDGTRTRVERYDDCTSGRPVSHVVVDGGGHYVPGDRPFPLAVRLLVGGRLPRDFGAYDLAWRLAADALRDRTADAQWREP